MRIEHSARDGCIVVTPVGQLDLAAAPKVRRALLKHLADQPDAVICDLAGLARIDPACASVFAAVAHRPRSRWPDSHLLLCGARPAVAAALTRQGTPRLLPVYDTLDQALAQARSRPPFLRSGCAWPRPWRRSPRRGGSPARCASAGSWTSWPRPPARWRVSW
jgi:anti-anti-sigma factor